MQYVDIRKPRVGVGTVVIHEGRVLLGKRKGAHGAGEWAFAGGHLEFGEAIEECARRELAEETGLRALSLKLGPWTEDIIEESKHYITLFVFITKVSGELKTLEPHKCEGWEWFDWDKLPQPLFPPVVSFLKKVGVDQLEEMAQR